MKLLSRAILPPAHPYLNNKYTHWYYSIISLARARVTWDKAVVWHRHHIIPECFFKSSKRSKSPGTWEGNPDEPANLVKLTVREHLLCHWLLTKMVEGPLYHKMESAMAVFLRYNKKQKIITSLGQVARIIEAKTLAFKTLRQWKSPSGQVVFSTTPPGPQWKNEGVTKGWTEWSNGTEHTWAKECPGEGWAAGGHNKGKRAWMKNGTMVFSESCPGEGWSATNHLKNQKIWAKDGKTVFSDVCPGEGWTNTSHKKGMKHWIKDGVEVSSVSCPGEGWVQGSLQKGFKMWAKDGHTIRSRESPGDGWTVTGNQKGKRRWQKDGKFKMSHTCPGEGWKRDQSKKGKSTWIKDGKMRFGFDCPGEGWTKGHLRTGMKHKPK